MLRFAAVIVAFLAAGPAAAQTAARPGEPDPTALAFVERFSDDHLSGMLSRIGGQSTALRTLAELDGQLVAAAFDAQIDAAVRRHGDEWARNLALAWSPLLSPVELESLTRDGAGSPHADKYVVNREAAGAAMAGLSQELFAEILQEVLAETVRVLTSGAPAK